jgi:hypothetical protein
LRIPEASLHPGIDAIFEWRRFQVEFSMDCGGGEALGSVKVLTENSGSHQITKDES